LAEPVLQLRAASHRYGPGAAPSLDDVTFSVFEGERIAVLGGNGAGKSTLLQHLGGILRPDRGELWLEGAPVRRDRAGLARLRTRVGIVFQDPDDQLFAATVADDVAYGPRNLGLRPHEVDARVQRALEAVGIAALAEAAPHHLSHGQRKRAAIAGVLAMEPRVLVLDEPTAGLDPAAQSDLLDALDLCRGTGCAVVLSTHDVQLARDWADRAVVLDRGRVARDGQAHDVLSDADLLRQCRLASGRKTPRTPGPGRSVVGAGLLVAAPGSGTGKTSVACGLLRALRRRGVPVRAAKCGPDYLDPMWLSRASGSECPNLDPWMAGPEGVRRLAAGDGTLVVEGAMGLYDGIRPDADGGSAADVARILGLPVLLVVDAAGAARTVAATVRGLRDFGQLDIAGVVANRVGSAAHAALVADALRTEGLPPLVGHLVAGALPALPGRHLGLVPPDDEPVLDRLADALEASVDLDAVLRLAAAAAAPDLQPDVAPSAPAMVAKNGDGLRLGLSWDEAFRFAYAPIVNALAERGVQVVRFSPLADSHLPDDLDGLWLCGGYPELHARELSGNESMRASVSEFCASGRPVLAECGGLLYLAESLDDGRGAVWPMCGVVPARGRMGARMRALGYRTATARVETFLGGRNLSIRGHEFHWSTLEGEPSGVWERPWDLAGSRTEAAPEGWWNGSVLATWLHGWLLGEHGALDAWIGTMRNTRARRKR